MEDDLKILKVEYLSKHLLGHTQFLNLSLDDQTRFYKSLMKKTSNGFIYFQTVYIKMIHSSLLAQYPEG